MTSHADQATKFLLPIGAALGSFFRSGGPKPTNQVFVGGKTPPSSRLSCHSAGHTPFLHSHVVGEGVCLPRVTAADTLFSFPTVGDERACYDVKLQPKPGPGPDYFNRTPFWVMAVDAPVIKDHGDVWNLTFINMVYGLIGKLNLIGR